MRLIEFSEYCEDVGRKCYVNPAEVEVVHEWKYHSFRPPISEIMLKDGRSVRVWETVDTVLRRLK